MVSAELLLLEYLETRPVTAVVPTAAAADVPSGASILADLSRPGARARTYYSSTHSVKLPR